MIKSREDKHMAVIKEIPLVGHSARTTKGQMNRYVSNGLLLMASCLICLLCLEWFSSSLFPAYNPRGRITFKYDHNGVPLGLKNSTVRHRGRLGEFDVEVKTNEYGFRDSKDIKKSSSNGYLFLGDSFSWGFGVEEDERFSNVIESQLSVSTYNISIPATNIHDYGKLLEYAMQQGANIKNLIITICMVNDIIDYENVAKGPSISKSESKSALQHLKDFLWERSTLYNLVVTLVHTYLDRYPQLNKYAIKYQLVSEKRYVIESSFSEKKSRSSAKALSKLASKFSAVILIVPSQGLWFEESRENELLVHNHFINLLKERNIEFVDLKSIFERDGNPLRYYYEHDMHWNELGHQIAAQELMKAISVKEMSKAGATSCGLGVHVMDLPGLCYS